MNLQMHTYFILTLNLIWNLEVIIEVPIVNELVLGVLIFIFCSLSLRKDKINVLY